MKFALYVSIKEMKGYMFKIVSFVMNVKKDMVNTETNDPKYIYYLKQLKKIEVSYF